MSNKKITLDEMLQAVKSAHGSSLSAVVLYGSAASRGELGERSDYNLLIIVKDLQLSRIQSASEIAGRWAAAGNPPPLTFTEAEWNASADIFPMEFADVVESHRVLYGTLKPPQTGIDLEHLRLQLEQESMGKLLGLRQGAMVAGRDGRARQMLLEGAWSKILVLLRGLIRLHGEHIPGENHALVERAAALAALDSSAFLRVLDAVERGSKLSEAESDVVLGKVLAGIEKLVSHVNSYRSGAPTYATTMTTTSKGDSEK